jgi:hypothetical protein
MAKSGSEAATNFVPILWISQYCPNRDYSQYIGTWLILGFCHTISPPARTIDYD